MKNTLAFVVQNALICHIVSNMLGPALVLSMVHSRRAAALILIWQLVLVRLVVFFVTGYVVARKVARRHAACAAMVGVLLAVVLLVFRALFGLLFRTGGMGHLVFNVTWAAFFVAQVAVAGMAGWVVSLNANRRNGRQTTTA